jgi:arylsulfatase A-like enzyme
VLDVTLHSDQIVKSLLAELDARVGRDRYLLVLTADHGICPLVATTQSHGKDAGRILFDLVMKNAEAFLDQAYPLSGAGPWCQCVRFPMIYLNLAKLHRANIPSAEVEEKLAQWLQKQPGILRVFTRSQLTQVPAEAPGLVGQVRRSFHPDRAGDLYVLQKPYYLVSSAFEPPMNTTHGTPFPYDTHVPLLVYGPGIHSGRRSDLVTPLAVAGIFGRVLGLTPPLKGEDRVPHDLISPR